MRRDDITGGHLAGGGLAGDIRIPGTLDECGIGHREAGAAGTEGAIATRLTRRFTYEGEMRLSRGLDVEIPAGRGCFSARPRMCPFGPCPAPSLRTFGR